MAETVEEALQRSLSGVMGGLISTTVMHPVDMVQKRIQVQERKHVPPALRYQGIVDALVKTAGENGMGGLYEGLAVSWLSNFSKNSVFFSAYELLLFYQRKYGRAQAGAVRQVLFGMVSGMLAMLVTNPIQVIQTQQNIHSNSGRGERLSALDAYRQVVQQKGVRGLYAGITPSLVLSIYPALQNLMFDRLKKWYLKNHEGEQLPAQYSFLFGLLSNVVTLVVCYPLIYLKVRVQAQNVAKEMHLGTIQMARKIVQRDGVLGLWKGLQSQISNATLTSAIMYMSKEQIQALLQWTFVGRRKKA